MLLYHETSNEPTSDVEYYSVVSQRADQSRLSELEAWDLLRVLQGTGRYQIGSHNVDEVTVHYLTTLSRIDTERLRLCFDAEVYGWPTASLLDTIRHQWLEELH